MWLPTVQNRRKWVSPGRNLAGPFLWATSLDRSRVRGTGARSLLIRYEGVRETHTTPRQGGGTAMLVLTRKSNQSIMIGDEIEVTVLSIMGEKVRIGIQAPRDIPVFRKEVYLEIQAEQVASGGAAREEVADALDRLKGD